MIIAWCVAWLTVAVAVTSIPSPARAQRSEHATVTPRFNTGRPTPARSDGHSGPAAAFPPDQPAERHRSRNVVLQFLAASAGAIGGGIALDLLLHDFSDERVKGDEGYTRAANVGYLVGSFGGATLGAHLVGSRLGARSSVWATSAGALIGTAPLIALGIDEPYMPLYGIVLGWIPQAALATAGFRMGTHER